MHRVFVSQHTSTSMWYVTVRVVLVISVYSFLKTLKLQLKILSLSVSQAGLCYLRVYDKRTSSLTCWAFSLPSNLAETIYEPSGCNCDGESNFPPSQRIVYSSVNEAPNTPRKTSTMPPPKLSNSLLKAKLSVSPLALFSSASC